MKKNFILTLVFFTSIVSYSQNLKWKEYSDFYAMVKTTLHPAEYGDAKPVKDSASILLAKADRWQASPVPDNYTNKEGIKNGLKELTALCTELNNAVLQKKTDEEINELAIKVHNKFHYIAGKIMK